MEHSFTWLSTLPFVHDHRVPENAMASILVTLVLMGFAFFLRPRLSNIDKAVQPEDGVSARNIGEQFVEFRRGTGPCSGQSEHDVAKIGPGLY